MTENASEKESGLYKVVSLALNTRNNSKINRDLKKGSSPHTEHYAYPHVLPLINNKYDEEKLLRIAALVAASNVPDGDYSFGQWVAKNAVKSSDLRLLRLMNLNLEQALQEINRLLILSGNKGSFSWMGLARTLYYWGNGVSDSSLKARQGLLRDFYRAAESSSKDGSNEERD